MKRKYIKPEIELMAVNEATSLLQASQDPDLSGDINKEEDEEIRFQSKDHQYNDFGYGTWEDWDNGGSSLWN